MGAAGWIVGAAIALLALLPVLAVADEPPVNDALKAAALNACQFDGRSVWQSMAEREDLETDAESLAVLTDLLPDGFARKFEAFAKSPDAALLTEFAKDAVAAGRFDDASCRYMAPLAVAVMSANNAAGYGMKLDPKALGMPQNILEAIGDRCAAATGALPILPLCDFPD